MHLNWMNYASGYRMHLFVNMGINKYTQYLVDTNETEYFQEVLMELSLWSVYGLILFNFEWGESKKLTLYLCRFTSGLTCCTRRLIGLTTLLCWILSLMFSNKVFVACWSSATVEGLFSEESGKGNGIDY